MVKLTGSSGGVGGQGPGAGTEAEAAANAQAGRSRPAGGVVTETCWPARRPRRQKRTDASHVLRGQTPRSASLPQ